MRTSRHQFALRRPVMLRTSERQHGTIAIMTAGLLIVIMGMCGLALDLGMLYNRKVELQSVAETLALAAARQLDGTAAGVSLAVTRASKRLSDTPPNRLTYNYNKFSMQWSDTAIKFGSSPDGDWHDIAYATANPSSMIFVKVDTREMNSEYGEVRTLFMYAVSLSSALAKTSATAVAGRSSINVLPLGICALKKDEPTYNRSGELVEYGFRRGVNYDLMNLNSENSSPAKNYLINPFAAPGTTGSSPGSDLEVVKPFVCTGTMAMPRVTGGGLTVSEPFPLGQLANQLNSRFDSYTAPCNANSAPPDFNVKAYPFNAGTQWMNVQPSGQTAVSYFADGKLRTVADPIPTLPSNTAGMYGPLWSFTQPAKYSGTGAFTTADWPALYSGAQVKTSPTNRYPTTKTPYLQNSGAAFFLAPPSGRAGIRGRRVLNVPLLSCPVTGGRATAIAIGRFFMPVSASVALPLKLSAEFAGVVPEGSVGGPVELF